MVIVPVVQTMQEIVILAIAIVSVLVWLPMNSIGVIASLKDQALQNYLSTTAARDTALRQFDCDDCQKLCQPKLSAKAIRCE